MGDKQRGTVERITVDIRYADGTTKQRIVQGDELKRLGMLVLKSSAVRDHLSSLPEKAAAVDAFESADEAGDMPALMTVYDDGTYDMECRPSDHRPPSNR